MTRLFIENNELDIQQDFSQQITYAVDDLNNLDSKSTSFSKTIILPATANNNRLLGNIFEFANSNFTSDTLPNVGYNFNASKSAKARIEVNGIPVMKGVIRLLEIVIDGKNMDYEVALFGEFGGFFSSLGAKKIQELDFSAYNHNYSITNIQNSWDNANAGSGYYYPLIDYGNVSKLDDTNFQKKNYFYTAFRPALFVREYIDKIITGTGYTWESNFFNTDFAKRLIIPNNQNKLSINKSNVYWANYSLTTLSNLADINTNNQVGALFSTTDNITWKYTSATTFNGVINYQLTGQYNINLPFGTGEVYGTFAVYKNGTLAYQDNTIFIGGNQAVTNRYFTLNYNNVPLILQNNDTFKFVFIIFNQNGGYFDQAKVNGGTINLTTLNPILTPVELGDALNINDTIPVNILQKDFFTSIIKMFNLMVTEDKLIDRHLKIEPNIAFYNTDRNSYLDWSDKVDRSQVIKIKPMSEVNARYYQFKYKSDTDYYNDAYKKKYNENYGDFTYDNALEFAKETDTTEIIFAPTILVGYQGSDKVVSTIYKFANNLEESTEHIIRILQAKKVTGVASWQIFNSNMSTLLNTTIFPYAGHLDDPDVPNADISFGVPYQLYFELASGALSNNLFNTYYSSYMAEITDKDSRLVTCKMKFKESDIFNLDFGRFIWVDGVLYRLVKIVDYADNNVCEVQLLRVIYSTYENASYYELGQELNGGYIAYLDGTGQHGLLIHSLENSFGRFVGRSQWEDSYRTEATSTDFGSGANNTDLIIAQELFSGGSLAGAVRSAYGADWHLPSLDELASLLTHNDIFNYTDGFTSAYSTSSTDGTYNFYLIDGLTNTIYSIDKLAGNTYTIPIKYF
jgi:hypothetical protein